MIKPVDLPSSAGISFGRGDVRHFSEGDDISVPGISQPTRHLAERDNILAIKVNEVVEAVNNKEQFVPLPVLRTTLPPVDEVIVTNYRIPEGFEARVLNAAITATPTSANAELNIFYAAGFGNNTGEAAVTTSTEFTSGTQFYQSGELIVSIKNKGDTTLEVIASILLTMRPIGDSGSLLVGSVIQGQQGNPGQQGIPGKQGPPGTGGAGSPGMIWRGEWTARPQGYQYRDVVSFSNTGTLSSFFCTVSHAPSDTSNEPPNSTFWDYVARGAIGTGTAGPPGSASDVSFDTMDATGTLITGSDFSGASGRFPDYLSNFNPTTTYTFPLQESLISLPAGSPRGIAFLNGALRARVTGSGTLVLPDTSSGAATMYDNSFISATIALNGTSNTESGGAFVKTAVIFPTSNDRYTFKVLSEVPEEIIISFFGGQPVF